MASGPADGCLSWPPGENLELMDRMEDEVGAWMMRGGQATKAQAAWDQPPPFPKKLRDLHMQVDVHLAPTV